MTEIANFSTSIFNSRVTIITNEITTMVAIMVAGAMIQGILSANLIIDCIPNLLH
jgi:hypothetical protein